VNGIDVLTDLATRPRDLVANLRGSIRPADLNAHPGGHDNSIAWLLWHTGRELDVQVAHLHGGDEVWPRFRDRFGLGELGDTIGYGHSPAEARSIVFDNASDVFEYIEACGDDQLQYNPTRADAPLDEVIDTNWTPHVTRGVRLVSVVDDAVQHLAQAAYVVGMRGAEDSSPRG
jgi:hypothetical protein